MAQLRGRPVENKIFGIRIEQPEVDFATIARSFDVWSKGPITDPNELPKVLGEALKGCERWQAGTGGRGL
jgi:hypothetical protein